MKVFLDVGAHVGQTLAAALTWQFDRIVCFEPAEPNIPALRKMADRRTEVKPFGLWDRAADAPLYNIGTQGASLWQRPGRPLTNRPCKFVRASAWLQENTHADDIIWMKLNVEGAELDVLTDLLDSGEFRRIRHLLVMWDAGKIPEIAPRVAAVRERLAPWPNVTGSKDLPPAPTAAGRISGWIKATGEVDLR